MQAALHEFPKITHPKTFGVNRHWGINHPKYSLTMELRGDVSDKTKASAHKDMQKNPPNPPETRPASQLHFVLMKTISRNSFMDQGRSRHMILFDSCR